MNNEHNVVSNPKSEGGMYILLLAIIAVFYIVSPFDFAPSTIVDELGVAAAAAALAWADHRLGQKSE